MSELALALPDGRVSALADHVKGVQTRLREARDARKPFEGTWQLSMALAAGKHWQTYDRMTRTLRRIQDADPRYQNRELYSADMVTEYRTTMLGELGSETDRPQLLLQHDDEHAEQYQAQANRALGYGWDYEWEGDEILSQVDRLIVDLGTAAVRCRFDPNVGPVVADNVPFQDGQPVLNPAEARSLLEGGPTGDVQMGAIRQGRIRWQPLSPFNILIPPGVPHERDFPWEATDVPTPLADVKDLYGDLAAELEEDTDIGSILGTDTQGAAEVASTWAATDGRKQRLRDHVRLVTYFERPTPRFPAGRTIVLAGKNLTPLDYREDLPYQKPDGTPCSGITYFHWWRVTGRFWSRSLVEAMMDGQRLLDKRRTQLNEIIDRSMPFVLVEKDSKAITRTGVPGEFIEIGRDERAPQPVTGIQPGGWMQQDVEAIREDIEHATGIKGPRLGENPGSIDTYSQLALITEQEQVKREQIHRERKMAIKSLVEDSVYDIRKYWGPERQIMLAGDTNAVQAEIFDATRIPPFYVLQIAVGAAKPRSQAAKLKMVEDIYNASINAANPLPIEWYKASLDAGEALELPPAPSDEQTDKAQLENHMMQAGELAPVAYYDRVDLHIPVHRAAQDQAIIAGDLAVYELVEQHVQLHLQAAKENAEQINALAPQLPAATEPAPQPQPAAQPAQE